MSRGTAHGRLTTERKLWRKDHPHTDKEGGYFPITLYFSEEYPLTNPTCKFPPGFFHPNVYPSGTVSLSIQDEGHGWRATFTVKQIVVAIQHLQENPKPDNAAQSQSNLDFV
ncbi:SUMO-conjugating enzyme SCE1-like [Primulina eburnea]|uniref:SUMO-conjugating enzyme SCE1-like n=1 Tax=Primulina eburnea TaxID=1245227 RepID=UPI003C6C4EA0